MSWVVKVWATYWIFHQFSGNAVLTLTTIWGNSQLAIKFCDQKSRTSQVSNRVSPVTTPNMNECPLTKKGTILWLGYIRDATLPSYKRITLPKTNIAPEKLPSQKESSLQTISFQWFWLFVFRKIPTSADLPLRSPGKRWTYLCERWTSQQHGRTWRNSSAKKRGRPGDSLS